MVAGTVEDSKAMTMFRKLAADELQHLDFLKKQYNSFLATGKPDVQAVLSAVTEYPGESPIFDESFKQRITNAHQEMSALSIGIQLEFNAIRFYRAEAEAAGEATVKKFYLELSEWESSHYQALLKQYNSLKEDYWHAAGFAPF